MKVSERASESRDPTYEDDYSDQMDAAKEQPVAAAAAADPTATDAMAPITNDDPLLEADRQNNSELPIDAENRSTNDK